MRTFRMLVGISLMLTAVLPVYLLPSAGAGLAAHPYVCGQYYTPHPSPSATASPDPIYPGDCPSPSTALNASPSSSPATPSPTPGGCVLDRIETSPRVVPAGGQVTMNVITRGRTRIEVFRRQPGPSTVVRTVEQSEPSGASLTFRLGESHIFDVTVGVQCGAPAFPVRVDVSPVVSISAVRNGPRNYTFIGRVTPARGQRATLWRVEPEGRRVLTGQSLVQSSGLYRFDRRFVGSGRFGFQVDVSASTAATAGRSAVRPTVIH